MSAIVSEQAVEEEVYLRPDVSYGNLHNEQGPNNKEYRELKKEYGALAPGKGVYFLPDKKVIKFLG